MSHLSDLELVEHILQDLVIPDHVHRHGTGMRRVHQLARNRAKKWIDDTDAEASCFDAK